MLDLVADGIFAQPARRRKASVDLPDRIVAVAGFRTNLTGDPIWDDEKRFTGNWKWIGNLCEELARATLVVSDYLRTCPNPILPLLPDSYPADKLEAIRRVKAMEGELVTLIKKKRGTHHADMKSAIERILGFLSRKG